MFIFDTALNMLASFTYSAPPYTYQMLIPLNVDLSIALTCSTVAGITPTLNQFSIRDIIIISQLSTSSNVPYSKQHFVRKTLVIVIIHNIFDT